MILRTAIITLLTLVTGCMGRSDTDRTIQTVAFGSCLKEGQPQPILQTINHMHPDVFVFLGDNIYGDSTDPAVLERKWRQLKESEGFARLQAQSLVLATWDDHDMGQNDAGKDYPLKQQSKKLMLDTFNEPLNSPRREGEGVYDARVFGPPGRRVQIILLDTRWFRDDLERNPTTRAVRYIPHPDPSTTLLGAKQWSWLEWQLRQPADVRIIATSIQFAAAEHGFEKWMNFPHERQKMIDLIRTTGAGGVVFISGDRHRAEISRIETDGVPYPLFDITSSSLNRPGKPGFPEPNRYRVGPLFAPENFGVIHIDWFARSPELKFTLYDLKGLPVSQATVPIAELSPQQ